jgi:phage terminase large subunit GpA-like protein
MSANLFEDDQREWLAEQFATLTTELEVVSPSKWAESKRYLPPSVTALPGAFRFDVCPFLREVVDCLGVESPIREVSFMKGVQLCVTTAVLENALGYAIEHVKNAPCMLVTADDELSKLRMESYITPMLQASELDHLIKSNDEKNTRKTGKRDGKVEWIGGGFLVLQGAQNANKLRSLSIRILLNDELDGWPLVVGKDGDPYALVRDRTAAYEDSRKIANISTPTVVGLSQIAKLYKRGDQRKYFVCCVKCGFAQVLRWRHTDEHGVVSGIVWEMRDGRLVPGSVRYLCQNCGHAHINEDKTRLLSPEHGAEWRPTATPESPHHRSYHLSALYSPVGMQSWEACVQKWLEAWDVEHDRPRDVEKLRVFYNNVLGEPFEERGEKLTFEAVSGHRRQSYHYGEVPNQYARDVCGGPVLLMVCTVDVQADFLAVTVWGWCRERRAFLVDYWHFLGDTSQLDNEPTWGRLRKLIEEKVYVADDGRRYEPQQRLTLIDSGFRADKVYEFAQEYSFGVYPVKGRDNPPKGATFKEFSEFRTTLGTPAYAITVDFYKDRWHSGLRRHWSGLDLQPATTFNAPMDATDKQLKELTVETRRFKIDPVSKQRVGVEWHRPSGAPNELWDCLVYANAALDLMAWDVCVRRLELTSVDWLEFYARCENEKLYFTEAV